MPKIPSISYERPGGGAVANRAVGTAVPGGGATGEAISQLGQQIQHLGSFLEESYQDSKAAQFTADAQKELQDFSFGLKYGGQDPETGTAVAPLPPDQHEEAFRNKVDEINDRAGSELGGRSLRLFDGEFAPFVNRHEIAVKTNAMEVYQNQIQANTDDALQKQAVSYVNAETDLEKFYIHSAATSMVDRMVKQGVWTAEQGRARREKFTDDSESGSFYKLMENNPEVAIAALEGGEFDKLNAEKKEVLRYKAYERSYTLVQRENAQLERERRLQERDEKKVQEDTAKTGFELITKNKLAPDWVIENRGNLKVEDYKYFLFAASGKGDIVSDVGIRSDLYLRSAKGEDVITETVGQMRRGRLSQTDGMHIIENALKEGVTSKAQNWRKSGTQYIEQSLAPNAFTATPADKQKRAEAAQEWIEWADQHPKATHDEATTQYKDITGRYQLVDMAEQAFARPVPKFIKGGRATLDMGQPDNVLESLGQAQKENVRRYKAKLISKDEYDREKALIGRWGSDAVEAKKLLGVKPTEKK